MPHAEFANELRGTELRQYAELGFAFHHVAELDYQVEAFMLCVSKHDPQFCSKFSKKFPSTFSRKIDFVISCYQRYPILRTFGDVGGKSDPNLLAYGLEKIFSFRNTFFHSDIDQITQYRGGFAWDVTRHERAVSKNATFRRTRYNFGSGYLDRIVDLSRYFARWLVEAQRSMDGENVAEFWNTARKVNSGQYLSVQYKIWETEELP